MEGRQLQAEAEVGAFDRRWAWVRLRGWQFVEEMLAEALRGRPGRCRRAVDAVAGDHVSPTWSAPPMTSSWVSRWSRRRTVSGCSASHSLRSWTRSGARSSTVAVQRLDRGLHSRSLRCRDLLEALVGLVESRLACLMSRLAACTSRREAYGDFDEPCLVGRVGIGDHLRDVSPIFVPAQRPLPASRSESALRSPANVSRARLKLGGHVGRDRRDYGVSFGVEPGLVQRVADRRLGTGVPF